MSKVVPCTFVMRVRAPASLSPSPPSPENPCSAAKGTEPAPLPRYGFARLVNIDGTRIDQWLWGVRVFKTRSLATDACRGGHVRINGTAAKPASPVRVGDRIEVRAGDRDRVLEVARLIEKRVSAPLAAACLVDHSPPPPPREHVPAPLFQRARGTGRPTKRDRRQLDRFRGR